MRRCYFCISPPVHQHFMSAVFSVSSFLETATPPLSSEVLDTACSDSLCFPPSSSSFALVVSACVFFLLLMWCGEARSRARHVCQTQIHVNLHASPHARPAALQLGLVGVTAPLPTCPTLLLSPSLPLPLLSCGWGRVRGDVRVACWCWLSGGAALGYCGEETWGHTRLLQPCARCAALPPPPAAAPAR